MLLWLWNLLFGSGAFSSAPSPPSAAAPSLALREEDRRIFRYWDGSKERAIDPLEAWAAVQADPEFSLAKHPDLIDAGVADAIAITVRAARRIFDVPAWSESSKGLTAGECLALMIGFWNYVADLKKNTSLPLTSPQPTESESSGESITKPAADSSGTPTGPSIDSPLAS